MRIPVFLSGLCLVATSQAAIVITTDNMGERSTQYFDQGRFVTTDNGRPGFGIEKDGTCWFIAEQQRVAGPCDDMVSSMKDMRSKMMSDLSEQERAMVQQAQSRFTQMQQAPQLKEAAGQRIAGLDGNRCFEVGGPSHLVCIHEGLLKKIQAEMGGDAYRRMEQRFAGMAKDMGLEGMEESALAKLGEQGYITKDVQAAMPMGGMNTAMLQYLPPEQREAVMKQLGAAVGGGEMQGVTVVSVDENGSVPPLNLSAYPVITFQDYMQQMMRQMERYR
jgi:hypothetical protein